MVFYKGVSAKPLMRNGVTLYRQLRYLLLDNFNLLVGTWTELLAYIAETLPELKLFIGYVWQKGRRCWYSPRKSRLPISEEERLEYPSDDDDYLSNDEEFDGPDGWPDEAEALSTADQEYVDEEDSTSEELEYDPGSDVGSVDSEAEEIKRMLRLHPELLDRW